MTKRILTVLFFATCMISAAVAQTQPDAMDDVLAQIRQEGLERSQIMHTIHMLTDVYGPRLTGSPSLEQAGDWVLKYVTEFGLKNAHKEGWDFGYVGWENEYMSAHIVSPFREPLVAEVLGWTPGTDGAVTSDAFHLVAPRGPTEEELASFFDSIQSEVAGSMVLVGEAGASASSFSRPERLDDAQAAEDYNPDAGQSSGMGRYRQGSAPPQSANTLSTREVNARVDAFLRTSGAAVRLNPAGMVDGLVRAFSNGYDVDAAIPTIILRDEDFGRISRMVDNGTPVKVEVNVENLVYPPGTTSYNYIADLPGSEKPEEVVLIGGHLDSWHAATGATDNATGSAIMIEALRIIKALGLTPKRTIRLALWSGEEQGLLGSQAYVAEHYGSYENQKPDFKLVNGYINVDSGTGKLRGASVFGPRDAAVVLHEIVQPLKDLGVAGARSTSSRRLGGSDYTSFNQAGLPGISMGQDPIRYFTHTWHTNLDTYEQVLEDDVKQAAVVVAWTAYQLAMQDEMLPRFSDAEMPQLNVGTQ